jgi:hypothetical protein
LRRDDHDRRVDKRPIEIVKTAMQAVAVIGLAVIVGLVAHKGFVDIGALADKHSGSDFWMALVRYFFKNMAGGAS